MFHSIKPIGSLFGKKSPQGSQPILRVLLKYSLSLGIVAGAVLVPGCGSSDQRDDSSEVDGVKVPGPIFKTTDELSAIKNGLKQAVNSIIARGKGAKVVQPRAALKDELIKTVVKSNGLPRSQIEDVVGGVLKAKCDGGPCTRLLGLEESDIDKYLDEIYADVSKSKSLEAKPAVRQTLLASFRKDADEGLDIPCPKS